MNESENRAELSKSSIILKEETDAYPAKDSIDFDFSFRVRGQNRTKTTKGIIVVLVGLIVALLQMIAYLQD